jgi:peptide/nickel transport system substrate-binding protein
MRLRSSRIAISGAALLLVIAASACSSSAAGGGGSSGSAAVLTIAPTAENSVTRNFNPYAATSPVTVLGIVSMLYEPLLQFDDVQPAVQPWLATKYAWSDGGKTITFTIRQGVKWSNGTPLTAADVAFSYQLAKQYPAVNIQGLNLSSVSSSGDTVTLTFPAPQYQELQNIASVYIVPKAVWSSVGNPATYVDVNPVGTGPFLISSFTPQGIVLKKNPDYWQASQLKVTEVDVPIYSSDTAIEEALESGQVQWANDFIPGVQQLYVSKSPHNHFWGPPIYAVALDPNLTQWPTNQLAVRQAISLAVNRQQWVQIAESGQGGVLTNASGLPATLSQFIAPSVAGMTLTENISQAKAILKNAGFVMGSGGYFQTKSGQQLSLQIIAPSSFADWVEAGSQMVQTLRSAGIDATFVGQSVAGWRSNVAAGDFQLTPYWETTAPGITPYGLYNAMLNSSLGAPVGKPASGDFERLSSTAIDTDLANLAAAGSSAAEMAALTPIEQYVATQLPVIPVIADAGFDEYNDSTFTGWPSQANPYSNSIPGATSNEVVLLHLRPRS